MKKDQKLKTFKNLFIIYPWRAIVIVFGFTVLLFGIATIFLPVPGPAIIVIPIGLSILATEFIWARKLLAKAKDKAERFKKIFACKSKRS